MKKQATRNLALLAALLGLHTGCGSNEQKTSDVKTDAVSAKPNPRDTLKIYLQVRKMESRAAQLAQSGSYDSALSQYNRCIAFLTNSLQGNNPPGLYLYGNQIMDISQVKEAIYDTLKQPENAITCTFEGLKWAKTLHDVTMQTRFDIHIADKFKKLATGAKNDTAKKGSACREGVQYALAGARIIDSIKTNDMDDMKYEAFHSASKIYALLGNRKQATVYDKMYKDVYFKIYNKMPKGD